MSIRSARKLIKEAVQSGNLNSFGTLFKVTLTCALFYWIISQIDAASLKKALYASDLTFFVYALISHMIAFAILSVRWWYLYRLQDPGCHYTYTVPSYYLGLFCNNFLPTGMGGDVVRILHLRKKGLNTHSLVSSTVLDRIIGLISILLMGFTAMIFMPNLNFGQATKIVLVIAVLAIPVGMWFMFSGYMTKLTELVCRKLGENRLTQFIKEVTIALYEYRHKRPHLLVSLIFSIIAQYFVIICYVCLGQSIHISLDVLQYISIVPIVFLGTSLPISVGGFGVRESILVYLLVWFQVDTQAAIALSLLYVFIVIFLTLPGGLVLLMNNRFKVAKESG